MPRMPKRTNTTPNQPESKRSQQPMTSSQPVAQVSEQGKPSTTQGEASSLMSGLSSLSVALPTTQRSRTTSQASSTSSNYDPEKIWGGNRRGAHRNIVEIDILRVDGKPCTTNVPEKEIYNRLLRGQLKLKQANINSFHTQW